MSISVLLRSARDLLVVLPAAGALVPLPAAAHAILMESQPAALGAVAAGPSAVRLRFNSRVDHGRSRLALRSGGADRVLSIDPASPLDSLVSSVTLAPGSYAVRWQVLAVDGHITRGDIRFTVAPP